MTPRFSISRAGNLVVINHMNSLESGRYPVAIRLGGICRAATLDDGTPVLLTAVAPPRKPESGDGSAKPGATPAKPKPAAPKTKPKDKPAEVPQPDPKAPKPGEKTAPSLAPPPLATELTVPGEEQQKLLSAPPASGEGPSATPARWFALRRQTGCCPSASWGPRRPSSPPASVAPRLPARFASRVMQKQKNARDRSMIPGAEPDGCRPH